jgi:hypothetical protein
MVVSSLSYFRVSASAADGNESESEKRARSDKIGEPIGKKFGRSSIVA